jgi:hypothetical protein
MHQAAVAHGSKQGGEGKLEAQDAGAQIAVRHRYCMTRSEGDVMKCTAVLSECDLAFCTAVQVVENGLRQPATGQGPEILDANDAWRCHGA